MSVALGCGAQECGGAWPRLPVTLSSLPLPGCGPKSAGSGGCAGPSQAPDPVQPESSSLCVRPEAAGLLHMAASRSLAVTSEAAAAGDQRGMPATPTAAPAAESGRRPGRAAASGPDQAGTVPCKPAVRTRPWPSSPTSFSLCLRLVTSPAAGTAGGWGAARVENGGACSSRSLCRRTPRPAAGGLRTPHRKPRGLSRGGQRPRAGHLEPNGPIWERCQRVPCCWLELGPALGGDHQMQPRLRHCPPPAHRGVHAGTGWPGCCSPRPSGSLPVKGHPWDPCHRGRRSGVAAEGLCLADGTHLGRQHPSLPREGGGVEGMQWSSFSGRFQVPWVPLSQGYPAAPPLPLAAPLTCQILSGPLPWTALPATPTGSRPPSPPVRGAHGTPCRPHPPARADAASPPQTPLGQCPGATRTAVRRPSAQISPFGTRGG